MSQTPLHPRTCLGTYKAPGIFITATGTDVGKTAVTAALAGALHRMHVRVGICKPVATGCPKLPRRGGDPSQLLSDDDFASPDAALAARAAGLDPTDSALLKYLSPLRFAAPVAPSTAMEIERRAPDWRRLEAALDWWQENAQVLLIEGTGGWHVPLMPAPHEFLLSDLAAALRLPVLVVTQPFLGTINHTLLTIHAIQSRNLPVVGMVINRVPPEGERDEVIESNLKELPRLTSVPVRAMLPDLGPDGMGEHVPDSFIDAMLPLAIDWWRMVQHGDASI